MEPSVAVGLFWFVIIGFMFFAQHHVCDAYFVPAINVFVDKMRNSKSTWLQRWGEEAVAGATICALGCNGPELFSNLISLYTHSDAGMGVVVGSEIFNLLIIVGAAIMYAPETPLALQRVPFARDCFFYFLSIVLLYWALQDKQVTQFESAVLLGAAGVYVVVVYFTTDFVNFIGGGQQGKDAGQQAARTTCIHGVQVDVKSVMHSRMVDSHMEPGHRVSLDPTEHGIFAYDDEQGKASDRKGESRRKSTCRDSLGFAVDHPDSLLGQQELKYKDLREVTVFEMGVIHLEFKDGLRHVTLELTAPDAISRDDLLAKIEEFSLGRAYKHNYDASPLGACQSFLLEITNKDASCLEKVLAIPELLVDVPLKATLFMVDVKDITKQGRWPLCFLGSMFWLAVFSLAMVEVANQINYNIPQLPISFFGHHGVRHRDLVPQRRGLDHHGQAERPGGGHR